VVKRSIVAKAPILWTQWGEHARSILEQYNAHHAHSAKLGCRFHGPHFVTYECGEFKLIPFGAYADDRYSFECRPEFLPGVEEPLWTFVVMC
jgi:hypothetical protein